MFNSWFYFSYDRYKKLKDKSLLRLQKKKNLLLTWFSVKFVMLPAQSIALANWFACVPACTSTITQVSLTSLMEWNRQNFLLFWTICYPFTPLTTWKIEIWKTEKNPWRYHHFTKCTKNHDHMLHCSYTDHMAHNRFNCYFSFWAIFCTFTHQKAWKMKIWNTKKNLGDITILNKCTKDHDHMLYCSLDMACNGFNCYISFWAIFYPFTSLTAHKILI